MPDKNAAESPRLEAWLDSTLESVDDAEMLILDLAGKAGVDEDEQMRIGMAVRESMVNAVVHGNRYSQHKKVHLAAAANGRQLTIVITDQGEGFDMSVIPDPLAEENLLRQSGRGILLIKAFVDEFHVRRAERGGTEVRLVKYLNSNK